MQWHSIIALYYCNNAKPIQIYRCVLSATVRRSHFEMHRVCYRYASICLWCRCRTMLKASYSFCFDCSNVCLCFIHPPDLSDLGRLIKLINGKEVVSSIQKWWPECSVSKGRRLQNSILVRNFLKQSAIYRRRPERPENSGHKFRTPDTPSLSLMIFLSPVRGGAERKCC